MVLYPAVAKNAMLYAFCKGLAHRRRGLNLHICNPQCKQKRNIYSCENHLIIKKMRIHYYGNYKFH